MADRTRTRTSVLLMVVVIVVGSQMAQSQTGVMTAGETKPASAHRGAPGRTALTPVSNWNGTALAAASTCTVPDVALDHQAEAISAIKSAGLVPWVRNSGNFVYAVAPAIGTVVPCGSVVSIWLFYPPTE